jgi:hypothetical protein
MALDGGCFCGAVRFQAGGPPGRQGVFRCRACQILTGWPDDLFLVVDAESFRVIRGEPTEVTRRDLPETPTRTFCGTCGAQLTAHTPDAPGVMLVKIGTLDDPTQLQEPGTVLWTAETAPVDLQTLARLVGRGGPKPCR